jgi:hypothetical protein
MTNSGFVVGGLGFIKLSTLPADIPERFRTYGVIMTFGGNGGNGLFGCSMSSPLPDNLLPRIQFLSSSGGPHMKSLRLQTARNRSRLRTLKNSCLLDSDTGTGSLPMTPKPEVSLNNQSWMS